MADLTDRQRSIKELLDQGMGAREIGEELGISRNAVYQQIQRLRRHGVLDRGYTPSGLPPRETQPGADVLAQLLNANGDHSDVEAASLLALVQAIRETRDALDTIARRLTEIVPR